MITWIDFLNKLPDRNTSFIVKNESSIYLGIRQESESIWCVEDLTDDNVTEMNWQIDWDLGGFKWCYQDNIHESYRKYLQPERSKREDIQPDMADSLDDCKRCASVKACCHCGYDNRYPEHLVE